MFVCVCPIESSLELTEHSTGALLKLSWQDGDDEQVAPATTTNMNEIPLDFVALYFARFLPVASARLSQFPI